MSKYVFLIPLLPLVGFLINGLGRNFLSRMLVNIIGCGVLIASFVISLLVFREMAAPGATPMVIRYFDFIKAGGLDIQASFLVDQLSALFLLVITGIGSLIHVYSTAYMHEETTPHYARYFAYLNLFVFSMLLLVLGSNFVVMFVGWEGVGLCSYLLIGYWFGNASYNNAAKKAFVMNRIGDLGFLLAIFWMLSQFGSIAYADVFAKASTAPVAVLTGITILLFVGAMGKSAQIPLYTWLPDAMAGPTPVSALIHAATMVTAVVYMIASSNVLFTLAPISQNLVAIIGISTALLAATIALKQNDIKKVLAYSTVSQLGLMFLALGVGAYTAGVFHVMTHAFFKALLFLGSGSVIHAMSDEQDIILADLSDEELTLQMHDDLYDGMKEEIEESVNILLGRGWMPYDVLTKALVEGMRIVGIDFRDGILFVPEVLLAANAMKGGMAILKPLLAETGAPRLGNMLIGTVKGDIHDIGKNLVTMMMEGAGFEVKDLGINNPVENYVQELEDGEYDILGMSALLTTTMPYMKVVIDTMVEKGMRDDYVVLVGGAPLNEEFGKAIGADAYCRDAAVAVETAKEFMAKKHNQLSM